MEAAFPKAAAVAAGATLAPPCWPQAEEAGAGGAP